MLSFFTSSLDWLPAVLRYPVLTLFAVVVTIALIKLCTFILNIASTVYSFISGYIKFW